MRGVKLSRVAAGLGLFALTFLGGGCASLRPPSGNAPVVKVMLTTGYCPCGICCGWHRTWFGRPVYDAGPLKGQYKQIGVTATGKKAHRGTVAADTSRYPFGTLLFIEGYGDGRVEDQGGAIKGDHIDLFFPTHREAIAWGKRFKRVEIWIP